MYMQRPNASASQPAPPAPPPSAPLRPLSGWRLQLLLVEKPPPHVAAYRLPQALLPVALPHLIQRHHLLRAFHHGLDRHLAARQPLDDLLHPAPVAHPFSYARRHPGRTCRACSWTGASAGAGGGGGAGDGDSAAARSRLEHHSHKHRHHRNDVRWLEQRQVRQVAVVHHRPGQRDLVGAQRQPRARRVGQRRREVRERPVRVVHDQLRVELADEPELALADLCTVAQYEFYRTEYIRYTLRRTP